MTVAFGIMVGAAAAWALSGLLVLIGFDSWGQRFVAVNYLCAAVCAAALAVFTLLFGLDALGISLEVDRG